MVVMVEQAIKKRMLWILAACLTLLSCAKPPILVDPVAAAASPVRVERVFASLHFDMPLFLTSPPDGTDRLFVLEQAGRLLWFDNRDDTAEAHVAADLRKLIKSGAREEGLLGLAFHPQFKTNHYVFLYFTRDHPYRNVVARYTMDPANGTIDPTSELVILEVTQFFANHHAGMIAFPPPGAPGDAHGDGFLYISIGDGGWGGDPDKHGQDKSSLLAKILRIDIDHTDPAAPARHYAIPGDNPFVAVPGARGEIWAYGVRNAWRFSFDRQTGDLWAGDVGQDKWEEIDIVTRGCNLGWRLREGRHDFNPVSKMPTDLVDPIAEFSHNKMLCITGGYVYRGSKIPTLRGAYIYGDFLTGMIWAIRYDPRHPGPISPQYLGQVPALASFGEDRDGEIYAVSLGGMIFRIVEK